MLFHTPAFLAFFLVTYFVHWRLPIGRPRQRWLIAASAFFYGSWNPWLLAMLVAGMAFNFTVAQQIERSQERNRQRWFQLGLVVNLGLLAGFKYANFFLDSVRAVVGGSETVLEIVLPLGISFFTFEYVAYLVDVHRGTASARGDFGSFALYVLFFPRLVAGPIVRPSEFFPQVDRPRPFQWGRRSYGVQRFLWGYFKKAVLADQLAAIIDPVYANPAIYTAGTLWLTMVAYSLQIYLDFSGYTDMAIGLGHLLGYRLPENFALPYLAGSIREFWNRWHLSLSRWIRDYLYIPLGGSRGSRFAVARTLLLTMTLCGLWHGANWTFVVWGLVHGGLLVLGRAWPGWLVLPRWLAGMGTFTLVTLTWVPFRCVSFAQASAFYRGLIPSHVGVSFGEFEGAAVVVVLLLVGFWHALSVRLTWSRCERAMPAAVVGLTWAMVAGMAMVYLPMSRSTFIYFQF